MRSYARSTSSALLFVSLLLSSSCASNQKARQDEGAEAAPPSATASSSAEPRGDEPSSKEDIAPERASGFRDVPRVSAAEQLVVAAHPAAANAGARALEQGGSALDAVIAAQMMLTLVEPQSSGIGGGAFLLYWDAGDDELIAWDGRETAPASATPERFLQREGTQAGEPISFFDAVLGGRSVGVPGVVPMLEAAHDEHGALPWRRLFQPAIDKAEQGFELSPRLYSSIGKDPIQDMPLPGAAYLKQHDGTPKPVGTILKNPELAATLRAVAAEGASALTEGPIARDIVATVQSADNPGDLTLADLRGYEPVKREAICFDYRDHEVCGFPPPTSGGTTLIGILGALEPFTLDDDPYSVKNAHLLAEASRLAYADRGVYVADPAFVEVPTRGLIDERYLEQRAALIEPDEALEEVEPGTPRGALSRAFAPSPELPSTSHIVAVDQDGNVATMTTSIEFVFGSHLMVRGFLLNNQLTDFSFSPEEEGVKVANAVAPGKRPRSSMAPTLVFTRDEEGRRQPSLALGSPGGSRIIGYVANTIVGVVDHGLDVQDAVERAHIISRGDTVELERHAEDADEVQALAEGLRALGHEVKVGELNSGVHAVQWRDGKLHAGADPRREGVGVGR